MSVEQRAGDWESPGEYAPVPVALYRHFSEDGQLLYVGTSANQPRRTLEHAKCKPWFTQVVRIEIEWFEQELLARAAETRARKEEKPRYNKDMLGRRPGKGRGPSKTKGVPNSVYDLYPAWPYGYP